MGIDRALNRQDLCGNVLWIERPSAPAPVPRISRSPRIGVDYAGKWAQKEWRFFDRDSHYVSTARRNRKIAEDAP
jgi:DNA-3-methyladenine glycosylase